MASCILVNHEGARDADNWESEGEDVGKGTVADESGLSSDSSLFLAHIIYLSLWGQGASCEINERQSVGRR